MSGPKYPLVTVKLIGEDGNAFSIIARCRRAARIAGLSATEIDKFVEEATSGDYNHVLNTCMEWFEVE